KATPSPLEAPVTTATLPSNRNISSTVMLADGSGGRRPRPGGGSAPGHRLPVVGVVVGVVGHEDDRVHRRAALLHQERLARLHGGPRLRAGLERLVVAGLE